MRIRLKLKLEGESFPLNYHSFLQGIIYNVLEKNDYSIKLHDEGKKLENRPFKLFTFSEIVANAIFIKETNNLLFKSNGYFEVSSFDQTLILKLADYLNINEFISINRKIIFLNGYDIIDDNVKAEDVITFKTISPVVVNKTEEKKVIYLDPLEEEYKIFLKNNLIKKYFLCYSSSPKDFEILKIEKITTKRVYFRNTFYKTYSYEITFKDLDEKLINVIMTCGIGAKNSMGFGMLKHEKKNLYI